MLVICYKNLFQCAQGNACVPLWMEENSMRRVGWYKKPWRYKLTRKDEKGRIESVVVGEIL